MKFFQRLMQGRYGNDQLNLVLVVLYLLTFLTHLGILRALGLLCLLLAILRMMSHKIDRRRAENAKFLQLTRPITQWFKLRRTMARDKDHCYFKCPHCKQTLRVPRGKGKITITCRSCGTTFQEKS